MGLCTVVPVQEALHIDDIAHVQVGDGGVNIGALAAQVALYGEGVGVGAVGHVEVQVIVVACSAGAIPVVQESSALVIGGNHGQAGDGDLGILPVDQILGTQAAGDVLGLGNVGAFQDLKGSALGNLHLAGPLGLVAVDADLGAGHQLGSVLFGAFHVVDEVSAVLALGVDSQLIVPPGLMGLDIGLDAHGAVQLGGHVVGMAHDVALGLDGSGDFLGGLGGSLGSGGLGGGGGVGLGAACKGGDHADSKQQGNDLFHFSFSPYRMMCFTGKSRKLRPIIAAGSGKINGLSRPFSVFPAEMRK